MWSREQFDLLLKIVPFTISVDWDVKPSIQKYGHVNTLLAVTRALHARGAAFTDATGRPISSLRITPLKRKLTDAKKRHFSIVGHSTGSPLLVAVLSPLRVEIYFNQHFFIETETTYRQYFPSASVILRPRNFLRTSLVPSPGSWGPDITSLTFDWEGTFILEAVASTLTGRVRDNFRGYKLVPTKDKYFLAPKRPTARERQLLRNNGFTSLILGAGVGPLWKPLSQYIDRQVARLERTGR